MRHGANMKRSAMNRVEKREQPLLLARIDVARPIENTLTILLGMGAARQRQGNLFVEIDFGRRARDDVREQARLQGDAAVLRDETGGSAHALDGLGIETHETGIDEGAAETIERPAPPQFFQVRLLQEIED